MSLQPFRHIWALAIWVYGGLGAKPPIRGLGAKAPNKQRQAERAAGEVGTHFHCLQNTQFDFKILNLIYIPIINHKAKIARTF